MSLVKNELIDLSCRMDVALFPFDSQTCQFNFFPWALKESELNATLLDTTAFIDPQLFQENEEWKIDNYTTKRQSVIYPDGTYNYLSFSVTIVRRPTFYFYTLILPSLLLSLLGLIAFSIPNGVDQLNTGQ